MHIANVIAGEYLLLRHLRLSMSASSHALIRC